MSCSRITHVLRLLLTWMRAWNVELITAVFSVGSSVSENSITNLLLYKTCTGDSGVRNGSDDLTLCDNVTSLSWLEQRVQVAAAPTLTHAILIGHVPCVLLALFVGHWSDRHGRMPLVFAPLLGAAITQLLYWCSATHENWPAASVVWSGLPYGLTGQYTVLMMGLFCLLKDTTPGHRMALRVSLNDAIETMGNQLGALLGAQLLHYFGSVVVFQTSFAFLAASALLAFSLVRDDSGPGVESDGAVGFRRAQVSCGRKLLDLVDVRNVPKIVAVLGRKREKGRRRQLLWYFASLVPMFAFSSGSRAILFMYCRLTLHWDVVDYSYMDVVIQMTGFVGFGILLPVLTKVFPAVTEDIIGVLGSLGSIGLAVGYASANSTGSMLGVGCFSMLSMFSYVAARTCIFKCVSSEEAGKTLAAYSVLAAAVTSISQVVTTQMYVATIAWFPATCFVAFAVILLIGTAIYSWAHFDNKNFSESQIILSDPVTKSFTTKECQ